MNIEDRVHHLLGRYISAPQWVKSLVGTAYSAVPAGWRYGRAYPHFQAVLKDRDPGHIAAYARARLAETLNWAVNTVPAYRDHAEALRRSDDPAQALANFPTTTKADIKAALDRYLSTQLPEGNRMAAFTGGSTAEPMRFFLERYVTRPKEYAFMEDFHSRLGYTGSETVLALRGRTVPTAAEPGGRLWMYEPIKRQLILSSDHLEPRWMPHYIDALRQWKPRFIQAFPSALYPLARWLSENPAPDVCECIRGIMLYSENLYGFQEQAFRDVFSCPVLTHYGHSERVLMAASSPDDHRCYFWPQYGWLELLDEEGRPVTRPGEVGEIVGTSFDNRAMPFIRYRTGDMAVLSDRPANPAMAAFPVVERIEGRLQEFIVCSDHRLVSICTIGAAHLEALAKVAAIQYEQTEPGLVLLKAVPSGPLSDEEKRDAERAIAEKTQFGCQARFVEVAEIPRTARGKHTMLIQQLDIRDYLGASSID